MALPEISECGIHKRSNSGYAEERGRHPPIQHPLSEYNKNFNSYPVELSRKKKVQTELCTCPGRCPHEWYGLSIDWLAKKDVDGCQSKMRNTSSSKRKRKQHQHDGDRTSPITLPDVSSPQSLEEIPASPSNTENEGIATSCKRIRLSTPETRKRDHRSAFVVVSHTRNRSINEPGDSTSVPTLESDSTRVYIDGEVRELKVLSEKGGKFKGKTTGRDILSRYRGPANNFPDYGPPVVPNAVALELRRNKMPGGERKKVGIPGGFKPHNNLQRNGGSQSSFPRRPPKKVFDLHENAFNKTPDEPRESKRQKISTENLDRMDSSNSVIDLSADGSYVGRVPNLSSSPTPRRTVQSVGTRSHYKNQVNSVTLGNIDEYKRTEAIIGFGPEKQRKAIIAEVERRHSWREELDKSSGLHPKSSNLLFTSNGRYSASVNSGEKPILIDDPATDEEVEVGQLPVACQNKTREGTPGPETDKISITKEEPRYNISSGKRSTIDFGGSDTDVSDGSPRITIENTKNLRRKHSNSPKSPGNAIDHVQFLEEDSVDLLNHSDDLTGVQQEAESGSRSDHHLVENFAVTRSRSISQKGDIPQSELSKVKASRNQTGRTSKPELSFEITYMRSGSKSLKVSADCVPWKLQYDYDKKEFDIMAYGDSVCETYPSLALKPEKIHRVKYHDVSARVVISRATEANIGSASQVLIQMSRSDDAGRFAQCLKGMNDTIRLMLLKSSEQLDKIFAMATKSTHASKPEPQEIARIEVAVARHSTTQDKSQVATAESKKVSVEDCSQPANIGRRRRSSTYEHDNATEIPKQRIVKRMQQNFLDEASVMSRVIRTSFPEENALSGRQNSLETEDFYGSRPVTRASAGQWKGVRQLRPIRSRTPSPVRWTMENPSWKEEMSWKTSLLFPAEGKKRATVDARDIERLDEGGFLNDNLIAFYLRYLEDCLEKSKPKLARRIYFQNTFFYETLTKGKVRSNNINYDAVKRWTSKVDLFSYDYIVVPVCEKVHWYVAIICNGPKLLQMDSPGVQKSQDYNEQAIPPIKARLLAQLEDDDDDSEASKMLDSSNEAAELRSATSSVIGQVEHMSLDDQDWPEPDAVPGRLQSGMAQLQGIRMNKSNNKDLTERDRSENQGKDEEGVRPKGKKFKRKSIPPARKYDPSDPRIITLDSLGGSHSPTCSNLREYLVCEAKARHNIDITPGRLGMTAKGLPQQSNYCDCGIFVLGYIQKFLENPDEFVSSILQGDMAETRDWAESEVPKMRESIRNLIFQLHAKQMRDEKEQHRNISKAKASITEAQTRGSDMHLTNERRLASRTSSGPAQSNTNLSDSDSTESVIQSNSLSTEEKAKEAIKSQTSEINRPFSAATEDHQKGPMQAKRSRHSPESVTARINESEIKETPLPNFEGESILVTKGTVSQNKGQLHSPIHSIDSSIQLDSPLNTSSSLGHWLRSPTRKAAEGSKTYNTFKEFAKNSKPPFHNNRYKSRHSGTSEDFPLEINDSQEDHQLVVRESPPRQAGREGSFENILDSSSEPRASKYFVSGDFEVLSPTRVLRRKSGVQR